MRARKPRWSAGLWAVDANGFVSVVANGGDLIARVNPAPTGREETLANAHLLAAAKTLYLAVDMVLAANGDLGAIDFDMLRAARWKALRG